jgi:hypothetical protein
MDHPGRAFLVVALATNLKIRAFAFVEMRKNPGLIARPIRCNPADFIEL